MNVDLNEASKILKIGKSAIRMAMKKGRIKHLHKSGPFSRVLIPMEEIKHYQITKHSREYRLDEKGNPIYGKRVVGIPKASKLFGIPEQKIYYLLRKGKLPYRRFGACYALNVDELEKYFNKTIKDTD